MPDSVLDKVWAYFDAVGPLTGVPWPIAYREPAQARLDRLRAMGVRAFPSLVYPHKPDMAAWLNTWAAGFARDARAAGHRDVVQRPAEVVDDAGLGEERGGLDDVARLVKVHLQVGAFDPRDPVLDAVWGRLAEQAVPVVLHCGGGPVPGPFTGPGPIGQVLARHPRLVAVVAHMGMPEYGEFLALARRYPRVHLDTTMAFTDFSQARAPFPAQLLPELADLQDRVVLGTDFPNTPYPYAHQLASLARLGLGAPWLRAVLHDNGARLLGA
jgi:hypothetical protein